MAREAAHDIAAGFFVQFQLELLALGGFLEKIAERAEAVIRLVEPGPAPLQCLLDHGAPELA